LTSNPDPVDIQAWQDIAPERLAGSSELLEVYTEKYLGVARAQKYARLAGTGYDEIGFRAMAATTLVKGHHPLQTFAQARLDLSLAVSRTLPPGVQTLLDQAAKLRHRPIGGPSGRFRYEVRGGLFTLIRMDEPDGVLWSYPLGAPPSVLLESATDFDARPLFTQHPLGNLPPMHWLPLLALTDTGRFDRMQDCQTTLVSEPEPGRFYCFVSHRWLTPAAPDPEDRQAGLTAWQLVSAVCEAVYVAHDRGLHVPRKHSPLIGMAIGRCGSGLSEALIVNVLRYALDDPGLAAVHAEILALQQVTADNGVRAAHQDIGLDRLRELVATHPLLRDLLARVHLWYDFSCLPQEPRTAAEQAEFEDGIGRLRVFQMLSRTAVLLDEADDYLGRAWCTLEVLTADAIAGIDVLVGGNRPTADSETTEHHLDMLLQDWPHVVWRALLDTEVFGVQTPAECLRRLGLAATDAADLPVIYAGLCQIGAPMRIHVDNSEVVTGTFPLPVVDRSVLLPATGGRSPRRHQGKTTTLDWHELLRLRDSTVTVIPSHLDTDRLRDPSCHVVVLGSCEGESVLLSDGVLERLAELERAVGGSIGSLSWLATDVAPVGHFTQGTLRTAMVEADLWVLVAHSTRFEHCTVTGAVLNALLGAGTPVFTLAVDLIEDNLVRLQPVDPADIVVGVDVDLARMTVWRGGLFRDHLLGELRAAVGGGS
jgi:hypothetical protein